MQLSSLLLNPRSAQAQTDLASPYQLHKTLANAFGEAPDGLHRQTHGVLFRVEDPAPDGAPVLVQSTTEPSWDRLPPGYLLRLDGPKAFDPTFQDGQVLRFRLVANPVRRVRIEGKKHARRLGIIHPHARTEGEVGYFDWLDRKAEASGFTVLEVADVPFRLDRKRRVGTRAIDKSHIPHVGVRFEGLLRVTEPMALRKAVEHGLGPAKAFGFGLLSLARSG